MGRYAVHVNANDIAVLGARPLWFFVVMLLVESRTTPELAETIMVDVRATCEELGITLGGGQTEITQGLDRPILIGQMLGEVTPTHLVRKTRTAVGDLILLTRDMAIEGTAILAREKSEQLRARVDSALLARAACFLSEPGISVVSAALAAANVGEEVHAMHDPTEGGLATGLFGEPVTEKQLRAHYEDLKFVRVLRPHILNIAGHRNGAMNQLLTVQELAYLLQVPKEWIFEHTNLRSKEGVAVKAQFASTKS
ncbi:MAG TPA: AIR synthase related protein [Terriglobales bacterium]|nr:AIR synthase related protein [Terriglobales bacterium]